VSLSDRMPTEVRRNGPQCSVPGFLDALPADVAAELVKLMAMSPARVKHSVLWRSLRAEVAEIGDPVLVAELPSQQTISRHRKRDCRCTP